MFRMIKKPYRVGHSTTTKEFSMLLSNTNKAAHSLNTAVFAIKTNEKINTRANFICRIYGDYYYANEVGYSEYIISYQLNANYIEVKCIRNNMPSILPFGFNINTINNNSAAELEIVYIGGAAENAQVFNIVFMNNVSVDSGYSIDDISFKECKHTDISNTNIKFTPYYGDSLFCHNTQNKFISKSIPEAGGFSSEFIVAAYLPNIATKYSIRIPKRFPVWYVISSIADYTLYSTAHVYGHTISYIYNSGIYGETPLKTIPLYTMAANVAPAYGDSSEFPDVCIKSIEDFKYTTKELVLKYDGEDDLNWYYHAENLINPGTMERDNFIQIVGCKNWYNNDMKSSMTLDPITVDTQLTEKKLQNNTYILNKICDSKHIFYSSFLYRSGVDKYDYRVA